MRAKKINEFQQGADPYNTMGVGLSANIELFFKKYVYNTEDTEELEYYYKKLNDTLYLVDIEGLPDKDISFIQDKFPNFIYGEGYGWVKNYDDDDVIGNFIDLTVNFNLKKGRVLLDRKKFELDGTTTNNDTIYIEQTGDFDMYGGPYSPKMQEPIIKFNGKNIYNIIKALYDRDNDNDNNNIIDTHIPYHWAHYLNNLNSASKLIEDEKKAEEIKGWQNDLPKPIILKDLNNNGSIKIEYIIKDIRNFNVEDGGEILLNTKFTIGDKEITINDEKDFEDLYKFISYYADIMGINHEF